VTRAPGVTLAVLLLMGAVAAARPHAQPPAPPPTQVPAVPQAQPVFTSGVEFIAIDVTVVDKTGEPVKGLTPEQFAVTIDGKPRRVAKAEFVSFLSSAVPAPGTASAAAPAARIFSSNQASGPAQGPGRLIYLAVDQASFRPYGARGAMEVARKFIDQLQPSDRIGLIAFPPPGPNLAASTNHAIVRESTSRIVGTADGLRAQGMGFNVSLAEAIDIRAGITRTLDWVVGRECSGMTMTSAAEVATCRSQIETESRSIGQRAEMQANKSIWGLQGVIRALSMVRERKTLILVSAGLPVSDTPGTDLQVNPQILTLARAAAAANTSLYILHVDSGFLDEFSAAEGGRPSDSIGRDLSMMSKGLETLADASGGSLSKVVARADFAFGRVLKETSAAYVLAVEPAEGDRDGKVHKIRVKVNRPGVETRNRTELTMVGGPAKAPTPEGELNAAIIAPGLATALPVRVATHRMATADGSGQRVLISAEVGENILGPVEMRVAYVVSDVTGHVVAADARLVTLTPRGGSRAGSAAFVSAVALKPGEYVMRLAARDADGQIGSVDHAFAVGLTEGDGIRLSDLLLLDPDRKKDESVAPVTDDQLWNPTIEAYVEFTGPGGMAAGTMVTFGVADRPGGDLLVSVKVPAGQKDEATPSSAGAQLDVALLPPGDYVAAAVVTAGAKTLGRVERPLHVERRAGAAAGGAGTLPGTPHMRFLAGESGTLVRAFHPGEVLRADALEYFLGRMLKADPASAAPPPVQTAVAAIRDGQFDAVLSALEGSDTAALSPVFLRGLALFGKGDLEPAAAQFRASLRISPDFLPAAFYLGACYAAGGRDREAAGAWQTSLVSESDARIVYDVLADAWLRLREGEQASSILAEAREKWAGDDSFVPRLAAAQALLDHAGDAVRLLQPYLEAHPQETDATFLAIRLIYDAHAAGKRIGTEIDDAALIQRLAASYRAAGGPNVALADRWAAFVTRRR